MSAFGSSVINKSNKKLAPRAPVQRRRHPVDAPAPHLRSETQDVDNVETQDRNNGAAQGASVETIPKAQAKELLRRPPPILERQASALNPVDVGQPSQTIPQLDQLQLPITTSQSTDLQRYTIAEPAPAGTSELETTNHDSNDYEPLPKRRKLRDNIANTSHRIFDIDNSGRLSTTSASQDFSNPMADKQVHSHGNTNDSPAQTTSEDTAQQSVPDVGRHTTVPIDMTTSGNVHQVMNFETDASMRAEDRVMETRDINENRSQTDGISSRENNDRDRVYHEQTHRIGSEQPHHKDSSGHDEQNIQDTERGNPETHARPTVDSLIAALEQEGVSNSVAEPTVISHLDEGTRAKKSRGKSKTMDSSSVVRPQRKGRRKKSVAQANVQANGTGDTGESTVDATGTEPGEDGDEPSASAASRQREVTPEGAEDIEIDPKAVTMVDLCKETRTGKKSKLEAAFQNINWAEVAQRRKDADNADVDAEHQASREAQASEVDARLDRAAEQTSAVHRGPQLKLVNGQMVLDTSSLVVDRHAEAALMNGEPLEELEENDLTNRVNSHSWLYDNRREPSERKRSSGKSDPWSGEQTDRFYDALRMFGTDFFIISKMFPGKTRRHIKLKFNREERSDPTRLKSALFKETVPMSLAAYSEATGRGEDYYIDPDILQEELRAEHEKQKQEIEQQKAEQVEAQKAKQEAAAARVAAGKSGIKTKKELGKKSSRKKGRDVEDVEIDLGVEGS